MKHASTIALGIFAFSCLAAAPQGARAAGPSNPCALLTLGEAQSITHFSLTSSDPNPLRADRTDDKTIACSYTNDDSGQSVTVTLHDSPAFFPGNAKNPNTTGYRAVKNIGDKAWTNALAMGASVEVLKHGRFASIMLMDPAGLKDRGTKNYALALTVAKLVAKRM